MVIALSVLEKNYFRNMSEGPLVKLFKKLRQRLRKHRDIRESAESCEERVDNRLHDQATRLHVLEWEAYGHRRKRGRE
jgi:hypothetical protein